MKKIAVVIIVVLALVACDKPQKEITVYHEEDGKASVLNFENENVILKVGPTKIRVWPNGTVEKQEWKQVVKGYYSDPTGYWTDAEIVFDTGASSLTIGMKK